MPDKPDFFEAAFAKPPPAAPKPQHVVRDEVVMTPLPPEDDDGPELKVLPAEGKSAIEIHKDKMLFQQAVAREDEEDEPAEENTSQFSLRDLMQVTFFAAVGFAIMHWVPADMFAGALGVAAILGMAVLTVVKPEKAYFYLIWWTLLAVYVIVSIFAIVNKKP